MFKKYVFRKYNPKVRSFFSLEKRKLTKVLGANSKIEHIGSTSIIGLGGKGILDIVIGISNAKIAGAKSKLEKLGYEFRLSGGTPERLFFQKDYPKKGRIHIHLTKFGGRDWQEVVGFRDYLTTHPKAVTQYVKIKKEAVKKAKGDGKKYRKHKAKFIQNILNKTLDR